MFMMFGIICHDVDDDNGIGVIVLGDGVECFGECECGMHYDFKVG